MTITVGNRIASATDLPEHASAFSSLHEGGNVVGAMLFFWRGALLGAKWKGGKTCRTV